MNLGKRNTFPMWQILDNFSVDNILSDIYQNGYSIECGKIIASGAYTMVVDTSSICTHKEALSRFKYPVLVISFEKFKSKIFKKILGVEIIDAKPLLENDIKNALESAEGDAELAWSYLEEGWFVLPSCFGVGEYIDFSHDNENILLNIDDLEIFYMEKLDNENYFEAGLSTDIDNIISIFDNFLKQVHVGHSSNNFCPEEIIAAAEEFLKTEEYQNKDLNNEDKNLLKVISQDLVKTVEVVAHENKKIVAIDIHANQFVTYNGDLHMIDSLVLRNNDHV